MATILYHKEHGKVMVEAHRVSTMLINGYSVSPAVGEPKAAKKAKPEKAAKKAK